MTTAEPSPVLEVSNLRVKLRTPAGLLDAVDGVDFKINHGEILGIVGESGSGKSVTALSILRLLDARDQITSGSIRFEGTEITQLAEKELQQLRGDRISIVFQDPMTSLNPVLRIGQQMTEGILAHSSEPETKAADRAVALLRKMGLTTPGQAMRRYPHQFSGGMRQRILLAMGFGNSPALLIADEPTTALDVTIQAQILDLLRELNSQSSTAIMLITHDLGVVASLCTRVAVMYAGRIIETGSAEEVLARPSHPYTQALIAAVPRIDRVAARGRALTMMQGGQGNPFDRPTGCCYQERCSLRQPVCAETPPLAELSPGHQAACWLAAKARDHGAVTVQPSAAMPSEEHPRGEEQGSAPLLELANLTKHFPLPRRGFLQPRGQVHALDGVDLTVGVGETVGLVGESGSGKSTLARLIVRLHRPTSGQIRFAGEDIGSATETELRPLRRHLQMVFQDPYSSLNPRMTVGDAVAEPIMLHRLAANAREASARAQELLADVGLSHGAVGRYPHEFSGGQRQRAGIARALAAEPRLIVCDEPISSLDVNIQAQILNLMLRLQAERQLTYVFISHNLAVVRQIAHRIAVLYLGNIVEIAPSDMIFQRPLHPYTRSLISAVPVPDVAIERNRQHVRLVGEVPSVVDPPSGCRFRTRCPLAKPICAVEAPPLLDQENAIHKVACHFPGER